MTRRLLTFILLLVHVDRAKGGANPNLQVNTIKNEVDELRQKLAIKDMKMIKLKQQLNEIENDSAVWEGEAIQMEVELSKQRNAVEQEKEKNKALNQIIENLAKQLAEKRQDLEYYTPGSPINRKTRPSDWEQFGAATTTASWIRETLTQHFRRKLPAHNDLVNYIIENKLDTMADTINEVAERSNLKLSELDLTKEGGFDQARQLLVDGHPLLLDLRPCQWGPIQRYFDGLSSDSEYLGLQDWHNLKRYGAERSHVLVVTQVIPPKGEKPGLYKIKNSYGNGRSAGEKQDILIAGAVLRAMKVESVFVGIPITEGREESDLEIIKLKRELKVSENERTKWKDEAKRLKQIMEWRNGEIKTLKGEKQSWMRKYLECAFRGEKQKKTNENLEKQLVEARRLQQICIPDSPIHMQCGPTCFEVATATWVRKTLTGQFFRDLPSHDEIACSIGNADYVSGQIELAKKEAESRNLKMERLDVAKAGGFDRAHELLRKGHPLLLGLTSAQWGPIQWCLDESSFKFLGMQQWEAREHPPSSGHWVVATEYIEPKDGKPGLYKIKNSHGKHGGSLEQKGFILVEDKVLREIKLEDVFVAFPTHWEEGA